MRLALPAAALLMLSACSQPVAKGDAAPAPAATPAAAPAQAPRAFVEDLYSQYRKDENFSPFANQAQWFDPELMAAIKEDEDLTPEGEVGFVDGDPICSCQDSSGMSAAVQGVEQTSPTTAVATVNLWANTPDERPLKLNLVAVNGQWRVHDVTDSEGASFLEALRKANAEARAPASRS